MSAADTTLRALLDHAAAVLSTCNHPDRPDRVDPALDGRRARRIGADLVERFEALLDLAQTAPELAYLVRRRDTLLLQGYDHRAQPYGRRIAERAASIASLVDTISQGQARTEAAVSDQRPASHARQADTPGNLKERADRRARELAPVYAEARADGAVTDTAIAAWLNARRVPANGPGPWTEPRVGSLRRRLARLGLDHHRPPVRTRTRQRPALGEMEAQ